MPLILGNGGGLQLVKTKMNNVLERNFYKSTLPSSIQYDAGVFINNNSNLMQMFAKHLCVNCVCVLDARFHPLKTYILLRTKNLINIFICRNSIKIYLSSTAFKNDVFESLMQLQTLCKNCRLEILYLKVYIQNTYDNYFGRVWPIVADFGRVCKTVETEHKRKGI